MLGCAYGLCLVSGLIEVGRLARPEAVGSLTAVYYALAYLGLTTPYLLTLAAPLAGPGTLLLIASAMALASAAAVAGASRPPADAAVGDILLTLRATAAALSGGTGPAYPDPSSGEREHGARRPTKREEKRHDATREVVNGPGVPTAIGPYSPAVRAGDSLFVSGQPGVDPETAQPAGSSFGEQARQTFRNLDAVLRAGGSRPELVVYTTVLVADANDFAALNELYGEFFATDPPRG